MQPNQTQIMAKRTTTDYDAATLVRVNVIPRRGLNRVEAARYVGISTTKFDELVREGQMPQPFRIGSRTIWDLRKLDAAFDELSGLDEGKGDSFDDWFAQHDEGALRSPGPEAPAGERATKSKPASLMSEEHPGHHHVYTPETLAKRWKCSAQLVRNLIRRGELAAIKYGGRLTRISPAAVIAYEAANTVMPIR